MRALIITALLLLAPAVQAGTAQDPELKDGTGDVRLYAATFYAARTDPLAAAHDVHALWASHVDGALTLTIQLGDLETIEDYPPGAVFWSYTRYQWFEGNDTYADGYELYMDLHGLSDWRAYLRGADGNVDLKPVVDHAKNTISVAFPEDIVGNATGIGNFRVQSSHAENANMPAWSTDWAPDSAEPCDCAYHWATLQADPEPVQESGPDDKESPGAFVLLPLVAAALLRRR